MVRGGLPDRSKWVTTATHIEARRITMSIVTIRVDEVLAMSRRDLLKGAAGLAAVLSPLLMTGATLAKELKTFRSYGIPTNAPPDWATFKTETGMDMEWLDIGPGYMGGFIQEVEVNKRGEFTD